MLKTEILVLRNRRFSESSLIATLLSKEHGRLDILAKGCRREKSPLFGHLDLYQREEAVILPRTQSGLDLLIEAAFVDEHAGLRFSPAAFAAAGLLANLAADSILPGEPQAGIYAALSGAFKLLSELGEPSARANLSPPLPFSRKEKNILIGRTVKLALLDCLGWLGFALELHRCVVCGRIPEATRPAALSHRHGGLICGNCRSDSGRIAVIAPAALAAIRDRGPESEGLELSLSPGERKRWLRFLVDYAQYVLEKPLRGKTVLYQLLA